VATTSIDPKIAPEIIARAAEQYRSGVVPSFIPVLPMMTLKGHPYTITDYAPFEPIYKLDQPKRSYYKTGRQVAKTTNMAAHSILQVGTQPHFSLLFVAPRYEQVRRISANYVRPFIEQSVISRLLQNKSVENSVLQKTFLNNSRMYFSFAFLDADRIRGLSVDGINYDEVQDIDSDFIPIIREVITASRQFGMEKFFGTPKTLDNTLQGLWEDSSQAEWVIKCGCGLDNIPSADHHLLKMIGPDGPICAKCGKMLNPRIGRWIHAIPENMATDAGYHIPQIILPLHYENPKKPGHLPDYATEKWLDLLKKQNRYDQTKFMNEVLGESCDIGVKLVTLTDIRNVSVLNKNEWRNALDQLNKYSHRVLAVDWSGGGEDGLSTTTYCVVGRNVHTGKTECIYTKRLHATGHHEEAKILLDVFKAFRCFIFAHDFGGAGSVRETLMIQAGMPVDRIVPFVYVRASVKKMVEFRKPPDGSGGRGYYSLDKARSLVLQATAVKAQQVLLPEYESSKDITQDLLALMEDRHDSPGGSDIFLVRRNPKLIDDFAHALNFGCVALWHAFNCYPDLSKAMAIKLTPEQANFAEPPNVTYE